MLDHRDMEEIVRSTLGPACGLAISSSADADHHLSLTISAALPAHPHAPLHRVRARIVTNGVDTFLLDLDDRFEYRDVDWDPAGQREILTLLAMLAEAYLAGSGREGVRRGLFGRRRGELTLELDGQTYVFNGLSG